MVYFHSFMLMYPRGHKVQRYNTFRIRVHIKVINFLKTRAKAHKINTMTYFAHERAGRGAVGGW